MSNNFQANDSAAAPKAAASKGRSPSRGGRAAKLRLLARLRGDGDLIWPGSTVPVTYEVDIFSGGASHTASGFLDGDFTVAHASAQDEGASPVPTAARLRLQDGSEVAVQAVFVASDLVEFDAALSPMEAGRLTSRG